MSSWGGGGNLITWPSSTGCIPARLELGKTVLAGVTTNPFSGQQQVQNWQASYAVGSCMMPSMNAADGQSMQYFLDSCNGIINPFQFPASLSASGSPYFYWLVTNGTAGGPQKYFRLAKNDYKVSMDIGGRFSLTFEFREAI
jgi:hypothetical protein